MSSKTTENAPSHPAWRHPERVQIERRTATIEAETESLRSRRDALTQRITEISDTRDILVREEPKDAARIAMLQREQIDLQNDQMSLASRLGMLDIEKGGLMQRLRTVEELEARGRGIAR